MEDFDAIVERLVAKAPILDPEAARLQSKLAVLDAWCEVAPLLSFKAGANSLEWLRRYARKAFTKSLQPIAPPCRVDYGGGRPSRSFQRAIDDAIGIARRHKLLAHGELGPICVLPIGTPNSLTCWASQQDDGSRHVVFQLGMHECLDGLLRSVLAVESLLPNELSQLDSSSDTWENNYREYIEHVLDAHGEIVMLTELLLAQTLLGGHPRGRQRLPLLIHSYPVHRILFRHVELFRVGHEIGHRMAVRAKRDQDLTKGPLRIGSTPVTASVHDMDEEIFADTVGFIIADCGLERDTRNLPPLLGYAHAGPDVCLSMFALLEDLVSELGGHRASVDRHAPARQRRRYRRHMVSEMGNQHSVVQGQRLALVLDALHARVRPMLVEHTVRGLRLSDVWQEIDAIH